MARQRRSQDDRERAARIARLGRESEVTLESVERRRTHLWAVAAALILGASGAVALSLSEQGISSVVPDAPLLRYALLALGGGFLVYAVEQERALRKLTRALFDAEILAASLQSRIQDLTTLSRVGRLVNSVLRMEEVLEMLLEAVFELTRASRGSVVFVEDDTAVVAVSAGADSPPAGTAVPIGVGVVGHVTRTREPLLITGNLREDQFPGSHPRTRAGSSICAPMIVDGTVLGVLTVERPTDAAAFTEIELRSVALFAEQAATAVLNARRYEDQRSTVERLADALERRGEFVAALVHELRTPLTAILGYSRVLETRGDRIDEASRDTMIGAITNQSERLSGMIDQILKVATVDAGADLRRAELQITGIVEDAIEATLAAAAAQGDQQRDVSLEAPDELPVVHGDADAMLRVFENLLMNAVKYSAAGSPIEVRVEAPAGDGGEVEELVVHVRDHGSGIAPDELPHIFERFRHSDEVAGSAGLGLYLVRSLVAAHGGRVTVDSELGVGSTFHVILPTLHADPAADDVPDVEEQPDDPATVGAWSARSA